MGYRSIVLDPSADCSAARVADEVIVASFDDTAAAERLAQQCDAVTLEFERIPYAVFAALERKHRVRPAADVLRIIQDRFEQRSFIARQGLPQPEFALIEREDDLERAGNAVGFPSIMKAARGGYDGKNQARVNSAADLAQAWASIGGTRAILERFVPFEKEISVILARNDAGDIRVFPVTENEHRDHILFLSVAPARVSEAVQAEAIDVARAVAEGLSYCGVMAVEMFVENGAVRINEIAPRVHNSGHYTFGACATSQFEQHLRAVCNVPLGDTSLCGRAAAMLNLLGDVWEHGEPRWHAMLGAIPGAKIFLYGKSANSLRRKVGHVLIASAGTADEAAQQALRAYALVKTQAALARH